MESLPRQAASQPRTARGSRSRQFNPLAALNLLHELSDRLSVLRRTLDRAGLSDDSAPLMLHCRRQLTLASRALADAHRIVAQLRQL
ncbi:hypothetical protein HZB60_07780 [candidate division KSB1 bacterium]|nr:hypothetical protein [candidate division KSB1 bacterium]